MVEVNSVLGPIDTVKLGATLMHEHAVITSSPGLIENYPELFYDKFMDTIVVPGLIEAKRGGIDTVVDCTTVDLGRNVNLMAEASRRSGVNIIACTGWWLLHDFSFNSIPIDQFAELWIRDINRGIGNTNVKAGILKGASDVDGVKPVEEKILRSLARAHKQTGVPICLHSYPAGKVGMRQLDILREEGVDLGRVKVDHSNDTTDIEYLVTLLKRGCWLGMDRYPGRNVSPLARTETFKALMDAGYANRLLISHDAATSSAAVKAGMSLEDRRERNPHGFLYIQRVVFPMLKEMGVSDETLRSVIVDNPRNFFEGVTD